MSGRLQGRAGLALACLLLVVGGALVLVSVGRTWSTETTATPGLPQTVDELTGRDLAAGAAALGVLALAGAGAVLAARGWVRRIVGGLLLLAAAAAVVDVVTAPGLEGAWPWVAATGAFVIGVGGLATLVAGDTWPAMGRRFDREQADGDVSPGPARDGDAWGAMDRGDDPTA